MQSTIKLRSNITRRKANKTAECPYEHSADVMILLWGFSECEKTFDCLEKSSEEVEDVGDAHYVVALVQILEISLAV